MNSFPNGHNKNRYHMKSLPREVSISRRSRKTLLNTDFIPCLVHHVIVCKMKPSAEWQMLQMHIFNGQKEFIYHDYASELPLILHSCVLIFDILKFIILYLHMTMIEY